MVIQLTKNEKKTLKLLLGNARISDSEIAGHLKISSQAVGKIRRKLEGSVINGYTVEVNYAKLGIHAFAIAIGKLTKEGQEKGELEVEERLSGDPHIVNIYRIPRGDTTHLIIYGFKDLNHLDTYFHSSLFRDRINRYVETNELYTFSHNSVVKNSPEQLLHKIIDEMGTASGGGAIAELENFKKRLR